MLYVTDNLPWKDNHWWDGVVSNGMPKEFIT